MKAVLKVMTGALSLALIAGCASTNVNRVDTQSTIDISGKWNDTDSRLVAKEMIEDALNQRWLYKYEESKKRPTVIVGEIKNKTHEHISIETFVNDIERALLNSGKVDFVASKIERDQLRDERDDQADNASAQSAKSRGEESGADLMLIGTVSTIVDQEGGKAVNFYQVDMELIELESHRKVWIGDKKIKKYITRAKTQF